MLASASDDGTIRRWNATTGAPVGDPMTVHTGGLTALTAWSGPDGPMLASGSRRRDGAELERDHRRPGRRPHDRPHLRVLALTAWSGPDGPMLASGGYDGTIRRWNATTGAPVGDPMTGHTRPGDRADRLDGPDGTRCWPRQYDGTIRRWNATTGAPVGDPITGHTGPVTRADRLDRPVRAHAGLR